MMMWVDNDGNVVLHSPDSDDYLSPYHSWGYYGSHSDSNDQSRCCFLSAQEAYYLYECGLLPSIPDLTLPSQSHYKVYKMLRRAGWTVRSGLQYGGDYLLYRGSPGQDHAPYVAVVVEEGKGVEGKTVAGLVRAAAGAKKQVVLVSPDGMVTVLSRWIPEVERMQQNRFTI